MGQGRLQERHEVRFAWYEGKAAGSPDRSFECLERSSYAHGPLDRRFPISLHPRPLVCLATQGLWPNYLKVVPSIAIAFVTYEQVKEWLGVEFRISE